MTDLLDSSGRAFLQMLTPALRHAARLWAKAEDRPDIRQDLRALVSSFLGPLGAQAWVDSVEKLQAQGRKGAAP